MRTCLECKHLDISPGYCWSEITREDASWDCHKNHFFETDSIDTEKARQLLFKGRSCPDFEQQDDLIEDAEDLLEP